MFIKPLTNPRKPPLVFFFDFLNHLLFFFVSLYLFGESRSSELESVLALSRSCVDSDAWTRAAMAGGAENDTVFSYFLCCGESRIRSSELESVPISWSCDVVDPDAWTGTAMAGGAENDTIFSYFSCCGESRSSELESVPMSWSCDVVDPDA